MKKMILGTDFGEYSDMALKVGLSWSRLVPYQPTVVHVSAILDSFHKLPSLMANLRLEESWEGQIERDYDTLIDKELDRIDECEGHEDLRKVTLFGTIYEELPKYVEEVQGDLLVLGTNGKDLLDRIFIGSVTQKMLKAIPSSLLIVKDMRAAHPKVIYWALDLDDDGLKVLQLVSDLALAFQSKVVVGHVFHSDRYSQRALSLFQGRRVGKGELATGQEQKQDESDELDEIQRDLALTEVKKWTENLIYKNISVEFSLHSNEEGTAGKMVILDLNKFQADLVIMGTHARTGIKKWVYGSTAHEVMQRGPTSMLINKVY